MEKIVQFYNRNGKKTHKIAFDVVDNADLHSQAQQYVQNYLSNGSYYEYEGMEYYY